MKGKIHQDDIAILNIYASNRKVLTFVKETLQFKPHSDPHALILQYFTSIIDMSSKQKINREILDLAFLKPNGSNKYLYNISPKHRRIYLILCTSLSFL